MPLGALALPRQRSHLALYLADQVVEAREVDASFPRGGVRCSGGDRDRARRRPLPRTARDGRRGDRTAARRSSRCSMTTPVSAPSPVPRIRSWMSRRRQGAPFSKYSLSPERDSRRVTTTSRNGVGRTPSSFAKSSETSATLTARRADDPWKITSSILAPRRIRARCSPSTHRTASDTLDFPQPFGPTMAVTPSSKCNDVVVRERLEALHLELGQAHLTNTPDPRPEGRVKVETIERGRQQPGFGLSLERAEVDP